ncbi:hypothetical protein [Deinococcus sp. QL22]|uniref:hypothetical protein n=1 Tax=Deinococcus sp. QL22 TaxID=2939437 RepID=UPI002017E669|nr:hypothetical protein [Deinococcus sp. QL22]UQN05404.1 hypothetical protein M1R55_11015 [Deinococcus sp. QL22]
MQARFGALSLDHTRPGFITGAPFHAAAELDPFLSEAYARFVLTRPQSGTEAAHARDVVVQTARMVHGLLLKDGRLGHCLATAQLLSRLLNAQGIWNAVINGALGVTLPSTRLSLPALSDLQGTTVTGHAWVLAPPFLVVDVSVQRQPWDEHLPLLPQVVLSEQLEPAHVYADTLLRAEAYAALRRELDRLPTVADVQARVPWLTKALRRLPIGGLRFGDVRLDYLPLSVPLGHAEERSEERLAGHSAQSILQQLTRQAHPRA